MRALILEWAFTGKLVRQDAADGPADRLLERSRAEMVQRMAARQAKQEKAAPPIAPDEIDFSLPGGWALCRMVDLGQFINGLAFKPADWGSKGRPIIRIQNLSGKSSEYNRTDGEFDPSVIVQDGDILVSWSATLDAFIWRGEEGVLNQHIFRVIPSPLVEKPFLFWLLKSVIRHLAESDHAHGLVMSHINRGPFLAHPIAIPPRAEQTRIAAKVDELMALCDRLEAQQRERETRRAALASASLARFADAPTSSNLQLLFNPSYTVDSSDLRRTVLALAIGGKLVRRHRGDASPFEEFTRLADHAVDANDDRFPSHWMRVPLGRTGEPRGGGTPSKERPEFWEGDMPWVSPKDMKHLQIDDSIDHISDAAIEASAVRKIPAGAILMVVRGMILARAFPVALAAREVTINQDMKALIPYEPATADFMLLTLRALEPQVLSLIERSSHGTCKLRTDALFALEIPFPPLAEQRRIIAKVNELLALVDQLEALLAEGTQRGPALLDAIVSELTSAGSPEPVEI